MCGAGEGSLNMADSLHQSFGRLSHLLHLHIVQQTPLFLAGHTWAKTKECFTTAKQTQQGKHCSLSTNNLCKVSKETKLSRHKMWQQALLSVKMFCILTRKFFVTDQLMLNNFDLTLKITVRLENSWMSYNEWVTFSLWTLCDLISKWVTSMGFKSLLKSLQLQKYQVNGSG